MKYCPHCRTEYGDDLQFCLEDGNSLLNRSNISSQMPTVAFGETETVAGLKATEPSWKQSRVTQFAHHRQPPHQPEAKKSNTLLPIFLTALAMLVVFAGAIGLWHLSKGGTTEISSNRTDKSSSSMPAAATPYAGSANSGERKRNTNSNSNNTSDWGPVNNQASLDGERITYYPGTTIEKCRADCDANPKCKAFTLIRAGAYNPADPPMCYLMSKATEIVTHSCCISAVRASETLKACEYFLSVGLYDKWKQTGGKDGKLGCPTMNEIEAEASPQGTTGRMTRFSKGDGGYLIQHTSGRFAGTVFDVSGCMYKIYSNIGGTKSWLGFPIKDGYPASPGARQDFENGYILWDSKTYNCQAYKN